MHKLKEQLISSFCTLPDVAKLNVNKLIANKGSNLTNLYIKAYISQVNTEQDSKWVSKWEGFNDPPDTEWVISGTAFTGNAHIWT